MTSYRENAGAKMKRMILNFQSALHAARTLRNGKLGNNTWVFERHEGGETCVVIILHSTPIVTYHEDESVTLNSGGHHTVTTKARMNEVLPSWVSVYQKRYDWFVTTPNGDIPFYDGMRIGKPLTNPEVHSHNPREQFFNTDEDVTWLFDTHLDHPWTRKFRDETKSFALYGNEDSPDAVILYTSREPEIGQRGMKVRFVGGEIESVSSVGGHRRNPPRSNPHMEKQIFQNDGWVIGLDTGYSLASPEFDAPDVDEYRDAMQSGKQVWLGEDRGRVVEVTYLPKRTWWGRYSAPGYLDATEWVYGTSRREVERQLR